MTFVLKFYERNCAESRYRGISSINLEAYSRDNLTQHKSDLYEMNQKHQAQPIGPRDHDKRSSPPLSQKKNIRLNSVSPPNEKVFVLRVSLSHLLENRSSVRIVELVFFRKHNKLGQQKQNQD